MPSFACVPGTRVEAMGDLWAAFSPASGETLLLNDTSVAILELLSEGAMPLPAIVERLARDVARPEGEIETLLRDHWPKIIEAGLVCVVGQASPER